MRRRSALARPGFIRKTASTSCEEHVVQVSVGGMPATVDFSTPVWQ
jgi:hypothetical protein